MQKFANFGKATVGLGHSKEYPEYIGHFLLEFFY